MDINPQPTYITSIQESILEPYNLQLDILRIDLLHPTISGNKWYKLKYNIAHAKDLKKNLLISFGGAYSNHLHALAFAGEQANIPTLGIVRGEQVDNDTLNDCKKWGMQLKFISRLNYKKKDTKEFTDKLLNEYPNAFIIPEGGSNELGIKGCTEIVSACDTSMYDFIVCAIGTGTTFAGVVNSLRIHQHAIGFTAMKNGEYLIPHIKSLVATQNWSIETQYAFGGFGKIQKEVTSWIQAFEQKHGLEFDFVYTAKMTKGLMHKIHENYFPKGSKILAIHTGGTQGNRSWK